MRKSDEVYWTTSLPKDHEALQALDAYCKEWGGLSRGEATRRLLMEWDKIQRGLPIAAWLPNIPSRPVESIVSERAPGTSGAVNKLSISNQAARAASRVLDD
jgi:hypothetical protein